MVDTRLSARITFSGAAAGSRYYDLELTGMCDVVTIPTVYFPGHMSAGHADDQPEYRIRPDKPGHILVRVGNATWS